jgi:hypothetical protein
MQLCVHDNVYLVCVENAGLKLTGRKLYVYYMME